MDETTLDITFDPSQFPDLASLIPEGLVPDAGPQPAEPAPVEQPAAVAPAEPAPAVAAPVAAVEAQPLPAPFDIYSRLGDGKNRSHIDNLNGDFRTALTQMLQDAPVEVRDAVRINSGFRDVARQRELFDEAVRKYGSVEEARKWAAPPGSSKHNHGHAADLGFDNEDAKRWVHANAEKYGLRFPMAHEPWHVEPSWARSMSTVKAPSRVTDVIRDAARQTGEDADYLTALANAESSLGRNKTVATSSAKGLFQFTDGTWRETVGKYGSLYGVQSASPMDDTAASLMAAKKTAEDRAMLQQTLGRAPSRADLYATWFLGRSGGPQFLKALEVSPAAPAYTAVSAEAAAANRSIFYDGARPRTVQEVYDLLGKKVQSVNVQPDLSARTDPRSAISPHDVWAPPPLPLDKRYTDAALEAKRMANREESMGFWRGTWESFTTEGLSARGIRALSSKGFTPDPIYAGSEEAKADLEALSAGLPEHYLSRFGNAVSRDHMVDIARQARIDFAVEEQLGSMGAKGTAARLLAGVADPGALFVAIASGGAGAAVGGAFRFGALGTRLSAGGAGAVGNVAIESATTALAGEDQDPHRLAMAAALGAVLGTAFGPFGRNPAVEREALEFETLARQSMSPAGPVPASAGAAVNHAAVPEVLSDPVLRAVSDASVPERAGGAAVEKLTISEGGKAASSDNPLTRMIGGMLGVDTVGKKGLAVNQVGADQEMARYLRSKQYDWRSIATPAYDEWARAQGFNWVQRAVGKGWEDFNQQVVSFVREQDAAVAARFPEQVRRAGEHFRKLMKEMAEDQRNPWMRKNGRQGGSIAGAENLEPDAHYVMRVWSPSKINAAIDRFGHAGVVRVVAASIKDMRPDIEDDLAEKFANSILRSRYTRAMGYDDRLEAAFGNADTAILSDMLRNEFQWAEDDIRRLLARLRHTEPNMPPHLKHRIPLNERFKMQDVNGFGTGNLGIEDLLENNADLVMGYYTRKVAGRVALARQRFQNPVNGDVVVDGIKSDADFEKIIRASQQWYIEHGIDPAKAKKEIEGLRWMYDRIKGVPDAAQLNEWAEWLRVARNYNFARMMGQIGFAQMMDTGRIVGTLGVKSFMQQIGGFRRIRNMDGRVVLRHGLDHELESMFGLGTDRLRGFTAMVWEEAGALKGVERGRLVDKAQSASEMLADFTSHISGMHYVNSWLQLMVGRSAAQKFATMATGRISKTDMRQLRFLGLSDDMLDRVLSQVRSNFTHEDGFLFGRRVAKMNLDQWTDLEARSAFENALFRWSRHIVQENDIGAMHRMMSHPIAQTLMQFRSYSMTAWENQLLHGLANPDGRTFAQFTASLFSGALVYAVQTQLQAVGRSDADKFLEDRFSPHRFGAAVFQRSGFSSLLPMIVDTAAVFTPAGPVFDARPSGQATDFIFGNPFFSLVDDVRKTTSALMSAGINGRELSQQELRQMSRIMFWQNAMPLAQGYSMLISGQPETTRR